MSEYLDLGALWRVAALSAVFGVGMVGLYALGIAGLVGSGDSAGPRRRAVAVLCFAGCLVLIGVGLWAMLDK